MTLFMVLSVFIGALCGYFFIPESFIPNIEFISTIALNLLILFVGIDVGSNKNLIKDLKRNGLKVLLIPLSIIGSLTGGIITAIFFKLSIKSALSIAAGFGWYSLSAVMLTSLESAKIGTIAFLTNVFREIIAVITIPFLAKKLNHFTAIAPAGATSMDTTLPIISKNTSPEVAIASFINGVILSSLVPMLISFIYTM
ncbi:TPA: lysine exporter LysO family protein [Clostridium botulinum]